MAERPEGGGEGAASLAIFKGAGFDLAAEGTSFQRAATFSNRSNVSG